jgi:hypothetical protein
LKIKTELIHEVISHHLRLFGVDDQTVNALNTAPARLALLTKPRAEDVERTRSFMDSGGVTVAFLPQPDYCLAFGVAISATKTPLPAVLTYQPEPKQVWTRLRTLHPYYTFDHSQGLPVVMDAPGNAAWCWIQSSSGGILFIGTDLAADFIHYRQGDPAKDTARPVEALGGVACERPYYLFEYQLEGEMPHERHADWWAMALARFLSEQLGNSLLPLLPGGAAGAVIITGDDDQALLEKYDEQLRLLGRTPITYFLHYLTRHKKKTIRKTLTKPWIDLGIHPDALDAPERYDELLTEQVAWFRSLIGKQPVSLRNHSFLNDGYWRQLPSWLDNDIRISSNLPGVDGRVLNGSLLPARLAYQGSLTHHWSLLTTFDDGMVFWLEMSDAQSGECIIDFAQRIKSSGVPGIILLNLHPQNVAGTRDMHYAALEIIKNGFHPWTLTECLVWFCKRDGFPFLEAVKSNEQRPLKRLKALLMRRIIGQN